MKKQEISVIIERLVNAPAESDIFIILDDQREISVEKLGKVFSAHGNTANLSDQNFGWLLIELRNSSDEFQIQSVAKAAIDELSQSIGIKELNLTEHSGKIYKVYRVTAALPGVPVSFAGHFYEFDGNQIKALSYAGFEGIRNSGRGMDFTSTLCDDAKLEDLDPRAVVRARTGFKSRHLHLDKEIETWSDSVFLSKLGLFRNNMLTYTALILMGKEESEHLISPIQGRISWIVKDAKGSEKGYQHFGLPLLMQIDAVLAKLGNLKYDYSSDTSFAPVETSKYEPALIRELIINAITHQDYELGGKINVVEWPEKIEINNLGLFTPGTIDNAIWSDSPQKVYKNRCLINALVKMNYMDDIMGGIRKVFEIQQKRNFPMPDLDLSAPNTVNFIIHGKVLNKNYTEKLVVNPDLSLKEVFLLDKVQKEINISEEEANLLRSKKLVGGRYPDLTVASKYSPKTGEQPAFVPKKVYSNDEIKQLIIEYLNKHKKASRQEIDDLALDKYPKELNDQKRRNKVKNLLYQMSRVDNTIRNDGSATKPIWISNK